MVAEKRARAEDARAQLAAEKRVRAEERAARADEVRKKENDAAALARARKRPAEAEARAGKQPAENVAVALERAGKRRAQRPAEAAMRTPLRSAQRERELVVIRQLRALCKRNKSAAAVLDWHYSTGTSALLGDAMRLSELSEGDAGFAELVKRAEEVIADSLHVSEAEQLACVAAFAKANNSDRPIYVCGACGVNVSHMKSESESESR